jgi:hypothetical protein
MSACHRIVREPTVPFPNRLAPGEAAFVPAPSGDVGPSLRTISAPCFRPKGLAL